MRRQREPAHDLERGGGVLFRHHDAAAQLGVDPAPPADVVDIEQAVGIGLRRGGAGRACQRTDRLAPCAFGRNIDNLLFGPAQCRQAAAEHTAGVDADRVVDPLGPYHRRMAIDHGRRAAIVRGPVGAHRQSELVDLARGLAKKRELPDRARAAADHFFLQSGMGDGEPSAVEPDMAAQTIEKGCDRFAKAAVLARELVDGLLQPVGDRDLAAGEPALQLAVMIALHRVGGAGRRHAHRDAQHVGRVGTAIDEVADEYQFASLRRRHRDGAFGRLIGPFDAIAEPCEQGLQLVGATVHVTDDVERTCVRSLVGPERLAGHGRGFDQVRATELPDLAKPFALQAAEATPDLRHHPLHDLAAERAIGTRLVARDADVDAGIEHDGDRQRMPFAGELDKTLALGGADIGGVDHGKPAVLEPLAGDLAHQFEGVGGDALVGRIIADEAAAVIRRDHLGR